MRTFLVDRKIGVMDWKCDKIRHFSDSQQKPLFLELSASLRTEFDKRIGCKEIGEGHGQNCEDWPLSGGRKGKGATLLVGKGEEKQEARCLRSCRRGRYENSQGSKVQTT